jgi:hypothetical protein
VEDHIDLEKARAQAAPELCQCDLHGCAWHDLNHNETALFIGTVTLQSQHGRPRTCSDQSVSFLHEAAQDLFVMVSCSTESTELDHVCRNARG